MGCVSSIGAIVADGIAKGQLVQVLPDWCPLFPGYFLYDPSRRHQPAALAALLEELRLKD
jgi:DNA-binding transcriptional LysR family regulator